MLRYVIIAPFIDKLSRGETDDYTLHITHYTLHTRHPSLIKPGRDWRLYITQRYYCPSIINKAGWEIDDYTLDTTTLHSFLILYKRLMTILYKRLTTICYILYKRLTTICYIYYIRDSRIYVIYIRDWRLYVIYYIRDWRLYERLTTIYERLTTIYYCPIHW